MAGVHKVLTGCEYCDTDGVLRAGPADGLEKQVYVCESCWKLLKDPKTALPLLRGHITMQLRGTVSSPNLDQWINDYMAIIANWKLKTKN